jgi:hypothetical protein
MALGAFLERGRLFVGVYPCGLVYADLWTEEGGDYKRLAFLPYRTLSLEMEPSCPDHLAREIRRNAGRVQARRGEHFQVSTAGQTVLLGG